MLSRIYAEGSGVQYCAASVAKFEKWAIRAPTAVQCERRFSIVVIHTRITYFISNCSVTKKISWLWNKVTRNLWKQVTLILTQVCSVNSSIHNCMHNIYTQTLRITSQYIENIIPADDTDIQEWTVLEFSRGWGFDPLWKCWPPLKKCQVGWSLIAASAQRG